MNEFHKNKQKGFTLIELLVAIAIIGVLSSIVLSTTNSTRDKSADVAALATARSVFPIVVECASEGYVINLLADSNTGGGTICSAGWGATIAWPKLPSGWSWINSFPGASPTDSLFVLQSIKTGGIYYVGCSYNGCSKNGPNLIPP